VVHSFAVAARRRRIVVLLLTCLAVATCPAVPEAWADGVPVDQATGAQKRKAQQAFNRAMDHFEAKRLDQALAEFRASYDIVASPNTRLMVVHVLGDLDRPVDAYAEALKTVKVASEAAARSDRYQAAAESARKALKKWRAAVGLVTVSVVPAEDAEDGEVPEDVTLSVAGKAVDRSEWGETIVVAPGQCDVVLTAETGIARKEIAVSGGAEIDIDIAPPVRGASGGSTGPDPGPDGGNGSDTGATNDGTALRIPAYMLIGLGVAGGVTFGVAGSMAQSNFDDLVDQCPNDRCPPDLESQADDTRTQQTVANIGLIVGAAGLATGVGLLVTSFVVGGSEDEPDSEPESEVDLSVGPGSLTITGSF